MSKMFEGQPDYEKIKAELEPYITKITKVTGKATPEYRRFKENIKEWNKKFGRAAELAGTVDSIQQFQIPLYKQLKTTPEKRRLLSVIGLYRYLGLIESLGTTTLDLLVILLIANRRNLHVERFYDIPRIVHASSFDDLDDVSLAVKLAFLERNDLKETSKFIDRKLRNAIAHLNFKVDSKGEISIPRKGRWKKVNIYEEINNFGRKFMMITLILAEAELTRI